MSKVILISFTDALKMALMSNIDNNGKKIRKDEEISVIFSLAHRFHSRLRNFYDLN